MSSFMRTREKLSKEAIQERDKSCLQAAHPLTLIATFVGGFTLSTFFSIHCPGSRTATLLYASSILFLCVPLALLSTFLVRQSGPIAGFFIFEQLYIAAIMLAAGLGFVTAAFYFYSSTELIRIRSFALVGFMLLYLIVPVAYFLFPIGLIRLKKKGSTQNRVK